MTILTVWPCLEKNLFPRVDINTIFRPEGITSIITNGLQTCIDGEDSMTSDGALTRRDIDWSVDGQVLAYNTNCFGIVDGQDVSAVDGQGIGFSVNSFDGLVDIHKNRGVALQYDLYTVLNFTGIH